MGADLGLLGSRLGGLNRGPRVAVSRTIRHWRSRYVPEFERCWNRFARPVGPSWRVDETYVKIRGKWVYSYRPGDR